MYSQYVAERSVGHVKVVLPSPIYAKTLTADTWDKNLEPTIHQIPQQIQSNGGMGDVEEETPKPQTEKRRTNTAFSTPPVQAQ
jgi:hypothetical protein